MGELAKREFPHRGRRQAQEPGPEHVSEPPHVEKEPVVLEPKDQSMRGRPRETSVMDDVGEGAGAGFHGVQDRHAPIEGLDGRPRDAIAARGASFTDPDRVEEPSPSTDPFGVRLRRSLRRCYHLFHYMELSSTMWNST